MVKSITKPKFIIVTGGVCSSLGKGIATASIGAIMKACGYKVFVQKLDPYLNVDPGTMSPFQHGEVFVTDDGAETDLDLGHYERFIDEPMSKLSTVTTGKIYTEVLAKERKGDFLGGTIQVVPHITNAIKDSIIGAARASRTEIMMVEVGGTVGDIEGEPYLEAIRQMKSEMPSDRIFHVHLTLLPYLAASKELKTKPTQLSVRELRRIGLQPDMILARADAAIPDDLLGKISRFCDVAPEAVIPAPTVKSIYDVPLNFQQYSIASVIGKKLELPRTRPDMSEWIKGRKRYKEARKPVKIAIVGKYTHLDDAYLSVIEAIKSAAVFHGRKAQIVWVDSEKLENPSTRSATGGHDRRGSARSGQGTRVRQSEEWKKLNECDGMVVPGGFGTRGIEGKILAANYARTNKVPYLGLCLGAQLLTIEFARAMLGDPELTSEEFDEKGKLDHSKYVVHFLPGQHAGRAKGGTLRLGAYRCKLKKGTKAYEAYKVAGQLQKGDEISERHRHRYEFNNALRKDLESKGLVFSGEWEKTGLMEIVEINDHPFMLGSQFHPEFKSRPHRPQPLFRAFVAAIVK